jgi:hypothetical protein
MMEIGFDGMEYEAVDLNLVAQEREQWEHFRKHGSNFRVM